jgi:hypothetical protein
MSLKPKRPRFFFFTKNAPTFLFRIKKKLNAAPDAGEDDLDFNIDSNFIQRRNF